MADQTSGALGSAFSGKDAAQSLAYGSPPQLPDHLSNALSQIFDPARQESQENKAFWAGMAGPNKSGNSGESLSNAMTAQLAARKSMEELKAQYIPLIMQSMTAQRANELAYAKFNSDRMEKLNPIVNSALYGLQANDQEATPEAAHARIDQIGMQYGMHPQELHPHHYALEAAVGPRDENSPVRLKNYLQTLRTSAAPAGEGLTEFGINAAGSTVGRNKVTGKITVPSASNTDGANPTKSAVELERSYHGDPGKYTDELSGTNAGYNDLLQRGNTIADALNSFSPGRYAKDVGGLSAATKDLARMFPNATTAAINDYVTSLMGSKGDGKDANPVAALQFAESLKTQEALAQLKTSLDGQGRIGQQELRLINAAMLSSSSDPKAFEKFMTFSRGRAANLANKLAAWGDYAKQAGDKLSVPAFDIPWSVNEARQLVAGKSGHLETPPGTKPAIAPPQAPQTPQPAVPSQQPQRPAAPQAPVDLLSYEPGTKIGPTGIPYVIDKGVPRRANRLKSLPITQ